MKTIKRMISLLLCLMLLCVDGITIADTILDDDAGNYRTSNVLGMLAITGYTGRETKLTFPAELNGKKVIQIGSGNNDRAFSYNSFVEITIPEGVEAIEDYTFAGCTTLRVIEIPGSIRQIAPPETLFAGVQYNYIIIKTPSGSIADNYAQEYNMFVQYTGAIGIQIDKRNFPDDDFREYIRDSFDTNRDNMLDQEEQRRVTEIHIACSNLTGIEYFTGLTKLIVADSDLTNLDVSKNTALKYLNCSFNRLTYLDVSKNTALKELDCASNRLTELDVSRNTELTNLNCRSNYLTQLDISNNPALIELYCWDNELKELDISKNMALQDLWCYANQLTELDVSRNPTLFVDDDSIQLIGRDTPTPTPTSTAKPEPLRISGVVFNGTFSDLSDDPGDAEIRYSGGVKPVRATAYHYFNNNHNRGIADYFEISGDEYNGRLFINGLVPSQRYWIKLEDAQNSVVWYDYTAPDANDPSIMQKLTDKFESPYVKVKLNEIFFFSDLKNRNRNSFTAATILEKRPRIRVRLETQKIPEMTEIYYFWALILPNGDVTPCSGESLYIYPHGGECFEDFPICWDLILETYGHIPTGKYTLLFGIHDRILDNKITFTIH